MGSITGTRVIIGLAIADDLKSTTAAMNADIANINKALANFDSAYKAIRAAESSAQKSQAAAGKVITTAEAAAKELGVAPSAVAGYTDANKAWGALDASMDKTKEI